jgi:hypothetical protein
MKGTTRQNASPSRDSANAPVHKKQATNTPSFADNSARTSNQLQLMNAIHTSPSTANQAAQLQRMFGATAQLEGEDEMQMKADTAQLEGEDEMQMKADTAQLEGEDEMQMKADTAQLEGEDEMQMKSEAAGSASPSSSSSSGGLPPALRAGVESMSGMDMSGVQVHTNSSKPKELSALAYTQGNEIHVGPGQEQHLPHEAWHVVQQRQGRVTPTFQAKGGVPINDDTSLEQEADVMGARAAQAKADPNRE